ncbi:MAG: phosphate ABC transporter permease subunit PstC [Ruminococcus sp.]|nr:phosphate ABC transporter permease subunit PstC [Ruminococcus sp.]
MQFLFLLCACVSILAIVLICWFMFKNGLPAIAEIGLGDFLGNENWKPLDDNAQYGILSMILGSLYVTAGAVIVGVPIGLLTAIFMAKFCPAGLYKILKPPINLLAGIPSIVYGFFGMCVIVPFVRDYIGGDGNSILTASILLGMMILPTVESLSETSIKAVSQSYYEGALALGATHERAVSTVIVPAAKSGILSSIILGIGRAIGETMAVIMVAGNQPRIPDNILKGVRTLTANIVTEMSYATGLHYDALIATGVVLFVFILLLNLSLNLITNKKEV